MMPNGNSAKKNGELAKLSRRDPTEHKVLATKE